MKKSFIIILLILISTYNYSQTNVALHKTVTASNTHSSTKTESITDGNLSTCWNAGGFSPQWVIIDLNESYDVTKINLIPLQDPAGSTTHEILVSADMVNWVSAEKFTLNTSTNVPIERNYSTPLKAVRAVKVLTQTSPSWIAWFEIEVYGNAASALVIPQEIRKYYVVSTGSFKELVEDSKYPVAVLFTAKWSQPCKTMLPMFQKLFDEYSDKVIVCRIDIDENSEIAQKYNIRSVPSTLLFNNGIVTKSIFGLTSYDKFLTKLGL